MTVEGAFTELMGLVNVLIEHKETRSLFQNIYFKCFLTVVYSH